MGLLCTKQQNSDEWLMLNQTTYAKIKYMLFQKCEQLIQRHNMKKILIVIQNLSPLIQKLVDEIVFSSFEDVDIVWADQIKDQKQSDYKLYIYIFIHHSCIPTNQRFILLHKIDSLKTISFPDNITTVQITDQHLLVSGILI